MLIKFTDRVSVKKSVYLDSIMKTAKPGDVVDLPRLQATKLVALGLARRTMEPVNVNVVKVVEETPTETVAELPQVEEKPKKTRAKKTTPEVVVEEVKVEPAAEEVKPAPKKKTTTKKTVKKDDKN